MIIKIAIADPDQQYVERLANGFEDNSELNLSIYTDRLSFQNALQNKKFDIILFSPDIYDGDQSIVNGLPIMLLDDSGNVPESCKAIHKINKYQRISKIYKNILDIYADVCTDYGELMQQGKVNFIAFYSPAGGTGKTTVALTTATKLATRGYRTLYLNLEDIPSDECYLPNNSAKGLSEILGSLGENINYTVKLQGLLQEKGSNLFYLKHFDSPNDLYELTEEEISELLNVFKREELFDVVVIDMGESIRRQNLKVFEFVDQIALVERNDTVSNLKMQGFLSQLHIVNEYGYKMKRIQNFDLGRESQITTSIPLIGRISAVQNPETAQLIQMLAADHASDFLISLLS